MSDKKFRVLLMCTKCDKVYNGTPFLSQAEATKSHFLTMMKNTDTCRNEGCEERLKSVIQEQGK